MLVKNLLNSCAIPTLEAELLLVDALQLDKRESVFGVLQDEISYDKVKKFRSLVKRRESGEPIAYILEYKPFWKHDFKVNKNVLIPRPDTEIIIETALEYFSQDQNIKILDLGTGSGCIIASLLHEYPNSYGMAVDIDKKALNIAKENCIEIGVSDRLDYIESDWFKGIKERKFDLIVSNPPYISEDDKRIDSNVKDREPHLALFASNKGLSNYKIIAQCAKKHLNSKGLIIVEIGEGQEDQVIDIFSKNDMQEIAIRKDLAQINRCIVFKI